MYRLRIAVVVLAGLIVLAGTALPSLTAQAAPLSGGIGIRLAGATKVSSSDPLARLYVISRLAPGASIRRQVKVSNTTGSTANVTVYAAGAVLGRNGFAFSSGHTQDQLSSWTSVSHPVLRLLPGASSSETVTVKAPRDASPGEDYAVIWAQVSAPESGGGSVLLVNRVGVRMYVSIGLGGTPRPNFTVGALTAHRSGNGLPFVAATVHNLGQSPLDVSGNLTLSNGPGGIHAGPFPVTLGSLVGPGGSEPATVAIERGFPNGPWHGVIRLSSGGVTRSAEGTLTFPPVAGAAPASSHLLIVVITMVALLIVLLASALAFVFRLRRRRYRSQHDRRPAVATVPGTRPRSAISSS
jgi:hypothetical protein